MKIISQTTLWTVVVALLTVNAVKEQQSNTDLAQDTTANIEPSRPIIAIHGGLAASEYDLIANFDVQYNPYSNLVANINYIGGGDLSIGSSGGGVSMYNFMVGL